jgi:hypothetical protein
MPNQSPKRVPGYADFIPAPLTNSNSFYGQPPDLYQERERMRWRRDQEEQYERAVRTMSKEKQQASYDEQVADLMAYLAEARLLMKKPAPEPVPPEWGEVAP